MKTRDRLRLFFKPWFVAFCLLYLINRFLIKETGVQFFDHNLDDLLAVPVVLHLSSFAMSLIYKIPEYEISTIQIIITVIYISLLFEVFLPKYSIQYHSDIADVCCYAGGGLIYRLLSLKRK